MAAKITLPTYLTDNFLKIYISCKVENTLSFLDKRCIDKLINCIDEPTNDLFKNVWDIFYHSHGMGIGLFSDSIDTPPHDKERQLDIFWGSPTKMTLDTYQETLPFFTNAIKCRSILEDGDDRITNAGGYFHSFKYAPPTDMDTKTFLNEQISWTIEDDKGNCLIEKIHEHLSRNYDDYRAIYCVFSGNKSLHLHTQWDINHLSPKKVSSPKKRVKDNELRAGMLYYWSVLDKEITAIIKKHRRLDVKCDGFLMVPDIYRRLSWGKRHIEREGEFFKVGERVPQVELYSKIRKRHLIYVSESRLHHAAQFKRCALEESYRTTEWEWEEVQEEIDKWYNEYVVGAGDEHIVTDPGSPPA